MGEWKQRGVERRDFRASGDGPEVVGRGKKKDTRRWCKGKAGREHVWMPHVHKVGRVTFHQARCETCGKVVWGEVEGWPPWA